MQQNTHGAPPITTLLSRGRSMGICVFDVPDRKRLSCKCFWKRRIHESALLALLIGCGLCDRSMVFAADGAERLDGKFPPELVRFKPAEGNPVFTAQGEGHWDTKIRERGWILKTGGLWRMWFTGYDGTRAGQKMLGYATSADGVRWSRYPKNPIYRDRWVEDMMVVERGGTFYMFAEGRDDQAHLLKSPDGIEWTRVGALDIRQTSRQPLSPGPSGTPTAWFEDRTWHLFYERYDKGVWLATSKDMKVWTNVSDDPVLLPGPGDYDEELIALNQIVKHQGRYYAYYHGRGAAAPWDQWCTNVATSTDLRHWDKFPGNPLQPVEQNKSSGIVVHDGKRYRLYTMHDKVELHWPAGE